MYLPCPATIAFIAGGPDSSGRRRGSRPAVHRDPVGHEEEEHDPLDRHGVVGVGEASVLRRRKDLVRTPISEGIGR